MAVESSKPGFKFHLCSPPSWVNLNNISKLWDLSCFIYKTWNKADTYLKVVLHGQQM